MKCSFMFVVGMSWATCVLALSSVAAEGPDPADTTSSDAEKAAAQAADHMHRLKVLCPNDPRKPLALIDQPLLAFGDSTRATSQGSLWAWSERGTNRTRPVVFLELYQIGGFEGQWFHAVSLAAQPIIALDAPGAPRWQPETTDFHLLRLEDAPEPAANDAGRLRQMRDIARRFTAHEFWHPDNSRHELRVLPQPVHRYSAPDEKVKDGAVFAIVHGTNPEAVVLIEILDRSVGGGSAGAECWQYAVLRSSDAEGHVELDGKEVSAWDRAVHTSNGVREPYHVITTPREP
ncbi:MAG TPA: hypothetical protein VHC22_32740 [Pirellulales bacterium]|nr:hypothetical protein [Pirellulales bacterium]